MGWGDFIKAFSVLCFMAFIGMSCAKPGTKADNKSHVISGPSRVTEENSENNLSPLALPDSTPEPTGFESTKFPFEVNNADWKLVSDAEGVQTYQKKTQNNDIVSFRGETLIPASMVKIATILNTDSLRKEWIDALVEAKTIEEMSKAERIEYNHTKVPWPFQDRDFVYKMNIYIKKEPRSMLVTLKSIQDPRVPPKDGIVRAEVVEAFYYLKEVEGVRATKVVVQMAVDPKGAIPLWMMNMVQKDWPNRTLDNLRKLSQREDIIPSDEINGYFLNADSLQPSTSPATKPKKKAAVKSPVKPAVKKTDVAPSNL